MGIESLSPWVSLLAGVLSIGYVVVEEYRSKSGGDTSTASGDGRSLGGALQKHDGFVITAITMFAIAGVAHVALGETVSPLLVWGIPAFVVAVTGIGAATGRAPDPEN